MLERRRIRLLSVVIYRPGGTPEQDKTTMQKITINLPLFSISIDGDSGLDLIPAAAFWLSLPTNCPECAKPLIFDFSTPKGYKYYKLKCTGTPPHCVNLGKKQGDGSLYYDASKHWELFRPGQHIDDAGAAGSIPANGNSETRREIQAGSPERKNLLIKTLMDCKAAGIRFGVVPGDVGKMDPADIERNIEAASRALRTRGE